MSTPLVSILMTSYDREKYIAEAIESVLASTYTNFELIIVDDGSKDNTVEIACSYEAKDSRVKVYVNEKNLGDYPNRNKAAGYAKGKYLKYVDADDLIYPSGLQILVDMMEKFPDPGYGLCSFPQDYYKIFPFKLNPEEAYYRHYFITSIFHRAPLSSIIKRDIFNIVGGFTGQRMYGDFELWHKLSLNYPVLMLPDGIVWNRVHDNQEMTHFHKFAMGYLNVSENALLNSQCPLKEKDKIICLNKIRKSKSRLILRTLLKFNFNESQNFYNESGYSVLELIKNIN
jgi:glycosyltransferase involved in cell wall biosynthesis